MRAVVQISPHYASPICDMPAHGVYRLFDARLEGGGKAVPEDAQAITARQGKPLRCRACHALITYQENAEAIQGRHVHECVNPAGAAFTVACFSRAWCLVSGQATEEWSWFVDCTWQYAQCPQCQMHLGWFYQHVLDGGSFYGLIVDRLISEQ